MLTNLLHGFEDELIPEVPGQLGQALDLSTNQALEPRPNVAERIARFCLKIGSRIHLQLMESSTRQQKGLF